MTLFNPDHSKEDPAQSVHQLEAPFSFNHSFEHLMYVQITLANLALEDADFQSLAIVIKPDEWSRLKATIFTAHLLYPHLDQFIDHITVLSVQLQLITEMGHSSTLSTLKEIRSMLVKLRQCLYQVNNVPPTNTNEYKVAS